MDATCTIQDSIHVFSLVHKYVSRILGTYHGTTLFILGLEKLCIEQLIKGKYGGLKPLA